MSRSTLVDRAERTTTELASAARSHLVDAEQHARDAAAAAQRAAEQYAATASRTARDTAETVGGRVEHAVEDVAHHFERTTSALREDVSDLMAEPETRRIVLGTAAGVGLVGVAVWLWRRRKRRREQAARAEHYETSTHGVPGWQDPRTTMRVSKN